MIHQRTGTLSLSRYVPTGPAWHVVRPGRSVGSPLVTEVLIQRLDPDLPLPSYAHPGDAGADLVAAADLTLKPGERGLVGTGIAIALQDGYAAFVHPRSGLAAKHGVSIVNAPGTVDAGYRGEIKVCLINLDPHAEVTAAARRPDRAAGHPAGREGQVRRGDHAARLRTRRPGTRLDRRFRRCDTLTTCTR